MRVKFYILLAIGLLMIPRVGKAEEPVNESKPWAPHPTNIDNYFGKAGSTWVTKSSPFTYPSSAEEAETEVYTIKDPEIINYRYAYRIYKVDKDNNSVFTGYYVSAIGAEVYLATQDMRWRRIYNFALSEGKPSVICGGINLSNPEWVYKEYTAKLLRTYTDEDNPEIVYMDVKMAPVPYSLDEDGYTFEQKWIQNIGSYNGMVENDFSMIDGKSMHLETFEYNDEFIYSYGNTSVDEVLTDTGLTIVNSVAGDLTVSGAAKSVRVFNSMGREFAGKEGHFTGLTPGIYIIIVDEKAFKRFVQ